MTERNEQIVADYLSQVSRASAGLPPARRDELISDLREHIETGRAELPSETEAQVRELLDRLGDPDVIARAAAEDTDAGYRPGDAPAAVPTGMARGRWPVAIIVAVVLIVLLLVLCTGFVFFAQSSEGGPA